MDVRGRRALVCVLVVVGCLLMLGPSAVAAVVADAGAESAVAQETPDESDQSDDVDESDQPNGADESDQQDTPAESDQLDDADEVHIEVFIHENGTATFTVDYRFENTSDDEWETLREDVENNPDAYAAQEHAGWNETLVNGQNQTGRDMELSDVSVTTDTSSAPRDLGHVEFTFEWSSFAHVELNRVEAGDALAGFTLVDDTTLQLFWPDSYTVREVDPEPDSPPDGSVMWDGDGTEFADDQPWLVLIENGDSSIDPPDSTEDPAMPWLVVTVALAVLAALGLVGWWAGRRQSRESMAAQAGQQAPPERATDDPNGTQSGPPPELLSNEERVLRLVEQRGGRVKQQEIVSELEWTEAKTSQVVGGLREDDEIEVFRIGRENVIALPEEE
ncbi:hypothetical protein D8Y22_07345 [Salinadaptatus halalkaliphilus]|uniref:DUF4897 domain-containing protein n=1 Tax=Salinadaptatus halalkaliphilus TaxID=2419781 RepID=A0A4S3TMN8_9EURY|nr:hypothetical protein [Salinadaptatus halalkaliphilus]THE65519.1 hypothetical protein D8Y22_07345 [Salinadaptatus halalkaliphilus]